MHLATQMGDVVLNYVADNVLLDVEVSMSENHSDPADLTPRNVWVSIFDFVRDVRCCLAQHLDPPLCSGLYDWIL